MISREWYLFFQGVFGRIGGADGAGSSDILTSLFEDAGTSETNAKLFEVEQASGQNPSTHPDYVFADNVVTELASLRDQVSELTKELDSIKQGILI